MLPQNTENKNQDATTNNIEIRQIVSNYFKYFQSKIKQYNENNILPSK